MTGERIGKEPCQDSLPQYMPEAFICRKTPIFPAHSLAQGETSHANDLVVHDSHGRVTLRSTDLGELAQEIAYVKSKSARRTETKQGSKGIQEHTRRIIHASNEIPRPDRSARVALGRPTSNGRGILPNDLGEVAPALESLAAGIEGADVVLGEVGEFGVVPHVADDHGEVAGAEVGTLGDVHADAGSAGGPVFCVSLGRLVKGGCGIELHVFVPDAAFGFGLSPLGEGLVVGDGVGGVVGAVDVVVVEGDGLVGGVGHAEIGDQSEGSTTRRVVRSWGGGRSWGWSWAWDWGGRRSWSRTRRDGDRSLGAAGQDGHGFGGRGRAGCGRNHDGSFSGGCRCSRRRGHGGAVVMMVVTRVSGHCCLGDWSRG